MAQNSVFPPVILDRCEALDRFADAQTDAERAVICAYLARDEKMKNREIRSFLGFDGQRAWIDVSRLVNAGVYLPESVLILWHENTRFTTGHARALSSKKARRLPVRVLDTLARDALVYNWSVRELESRVGYGKRQSSEGADITREARLLSEAIGREVWIRFDSNAQRGEITLGFFDLDDYDELKRLLTGGGDSGIVR